jgi:vacuolar-type H+-ATPase subunit I/STV1
MADQQAKVTSIEALESFRSQLIVFLTKAKAALDEISEDVRRTRNWLQVDQRNHWQGEIKRRRRKLDEAQQELFSAKLATFTSATTLQEAAVIKARRSMYEAEEKLRALKHWSRNFDSTVDPLARKLENLRQFLGHDMPRAVAYLTQTQKTLEAYAEVAAPRDVTQAPKDPTPSSPSQEKSE